MKNSQIISVQEARKLLGKTSKHYSDTQMINLINNLQELAKAYVSNNGSKNA